MKPHPSCLPADFRLNSLADGIAGELPIPDGPPAITIALGTHQHVAPVLGLFEAVSQKLEAPVLLQTRIDADEAPGVLESLRSRWRGTATFAADDEPLVPGHLHVAPPGMLLRVRQGRVRLSAIESSENMLDRFFSNFAEVEGPQSVAVLVDSQGRDGFLGLFNVARLGGVAIANDQMVSALHGDDLEGIAQVLPTVAMADTLEDLDLDWSRRPELVLEQRAES